MPVDEKQIEEAAQLFASMNDDTLEAVTEKWMEEIQAIKWEWTQS